MPDKNEIGKVILESGIEVKPVYTAADLPHAETIGMPGEFPFTRGIHPLMYRKRPWTMRQYAGFGTPKETNERFKLLIANGQNALNVAFDLPTQMGLDSDDPMADGEVGRVGMAVDTLHDMETAFDGIPIDRISTALTINAVAPIIVAMHLAVARKRGISMEAVSGTAQNDILKELIGRGAWIFPVEPSVRLVCDVIEYCARHAPKYNAVSVCGYHVRESGAAPHQEMGYAFEIAREYIDNVRRRGIGIDEFAPRLSFNFNVYGNLWEQVAKFRAGRRTWAKFLRDEFGAKNPSSMHLRMIAGGGGSGLTIEEPMNNIVRGAYYALVGALSGTQTMALCCYDEAYTIPSEEASLISLRTMQILAEEMGLCDTVDPIAGSYYLESLTDRMEAKIRESMAEVRGWGGMMAAIASGAIQRKLAQQAYEQTRKVQTGEAVKVGVNKYRRDDARTEHVKIHEYAATTAEAKIAELRRIKGGRENGAVRRALDAIRRDATEGRNVMPAILDAVEQYSTVGEITAVLKEVFGEFREPSIL